MSEYQKVTSITSGSVAAEITSRPGRQGNLFSFMTAREFSVPNGEKRWTPWMQRRHIADLHRLLDAVESYLDGLDEGD